MQSVKFEYDGIMKKDKFIFSLIYVPLQTVNDLDHYMFQPC